MILTRIAVNNPVFAVMVMLGITLIGWFSFQRFSIEQFPAIDFPVVVVLTSYPGASPETVEDQITRPIENTVNTTSGLDSVTSTSSQGQSLIIAQFDLSVSSDTAAQDVKDRVSQIEASLPDDAGRPQVLRFDPAALPIMSIGISSASMPIRDLTALADETIIPRLNTVVGVGEAQLIGGVDRQINILINDERLRSLDIGINEVLNAVRAENQDLPAGTVNFGLTETTVQVEGRIADPAGFLDIIVARRGGQPIYLSEVATVEDGEADDDNRALIDGKPALAINVIQVQGSNTIAVAEGVHETLAELGEELPPSVSLNVIVDNSTAIRNSVNSVQTTLIEGGVLAVLIVFLFLNSWRSTVITSLTLPISVIGTFGIIYFLGFTLNFMTLLALSLSIGLLIDDAIVVRENITRHLHMGKSHRRAALEGTNEIGLAVLATTLSIVAVFMPVAFMEGIIGRFFLQFGITVTVAVLLSLFVSFTMDPMLSSVWYDPASQPNAKRWFIARIVGKFDDFFMWVNRLYRRVLDWSLRHRKITLVTVLVLFVSSVAVLLPRVGFEFLPAEDTGAFQVQVTTPVGSSVDYTEGKVLQVENVIRALPEVVSTYSTINSGQTMGTNQANVRVTLVPKHDRERGVLELMDVVRAELAPIAGIEATPGLDGIGGPVAPIQVTILGPDFETLGTIARDVSARLAEIPGTVDIRSSLDEQRPILAVRVNRDVASDLGVSMQQIGSAIRPLIAGEDVTDWNAPNGQSYSVVVRLPAGARNDLGALAAMPITTSNVNANGEPITIRLDQVAEITQSVGAAELERQDLSRQVTISAGISGRPNGQVLGEVGAMTAELQLPPGYRVVQQGESEDLAESAASAGAALMLAVLFIYFVIASQFGSFLQPLAIMVSLPLSLIGVITGLLIAGSTLNIFSMIGFIMLMGLVTKNAILLVDYSNRRRKEGATLYHSLLDAGTTRFRPIVMTTLAMILGMTPLALALGEGSESSAPMAHAVIGGLISSTILTLVVVPVILTYLDGFGRRVRRLFPKAPEDGHGEEGLELEPVPATADQWRVPATNVRNNEPPAVAAE
ncbi:MAG: efflux RND transporter permease subunit [Bauldia sp.]|nr:efflux RND transporter permease subunit [Bauldia sp.]